MLSLLSVGASILLLRTRLVLADVGDGTLLGVSTLLDSGDPAQKIDIVFLGDGFKASEQDLFNAKVDEAVRFFLETHPFEALHCAFNIHRVNVASRESGTDVPATCSGQPSPVGTRTRATAMDTTYCRGSVFRCVGSNNDALVADYARNAPGADFVMVLVNDRGYGGCRFGNTTFTTIDDSFQNVVVHEFGHSLSDLADEYTDDDPGKTTFTDSEPGQANLTKISGGRNLKWKDLVSSSTPQPTSSCTTSFSAPVDLVGTYEGGNGKFSCGIFRPQPNCRMRESDQPFCSVCRRKLIQDIAPHLCKPLSVNFSELLVKNAQEPFYKGDGEIYFDYGLASNTESFSARWPGSEGEMDFGDGDSRSLNNFFAGSVPEPSPGTPASLNIQMKESDWPDGDDSLSNNAVHIFNAPGDFEIDKPDYRLRGTVQRTHVSVLFDSLFLRDAGDSWPFGDGDIYVLYSVSNGEQTIQGRWPSGGTRAIGNGNSQPMGVLAAAIAEPAADKALSIRIEIWDFDDWLSGGDDKLGDGTFTFSGAQRFGADRIVHVEDQGNYRLTFSIAEGP